MKRFVTLLPIFAFSFFWCSMPSLVLAEEPGLQQWFNENSYLIDVATNKTGMGTFPGGEYRATIRAEFAMYSPNNTFGWYSTATGALHQLFAGEDTVDDTADFSPTETFGVYIGSPDGTFYSEKSRNSDQTDHAWVFLNPKAEGGYVVAWEDMLSGGDKDYQDMIITIRALRLPRAAFTWFPLSPQVNVSITFNASDSTPGEGYITGYKWDFDDGNATATSNAIITHVYSNSGSYTAILNVSNNEGKSNSVSHVITVVAHPHAAFSCSPLKPQVNETATFNASDSTPGAGIITSFNWNFDDGNISTVSNPIITHTYLANGNYTVTLNITNNEGKSDSVSHIITVIARPHAAFSYSPLQPEVNEITTFNASASTPDGGTIVNYRWNFGDGNTTAVSTPILTHTFSSFGNFTVTLNVTDSEGASDNVSHVITARARPHAAFSYQPLQPLANQTVTFNASASTPDGGTITSYGWNFGDGNTTAISNSVVTHIYSSFGNYNVTLNVTDSEGKSASTSLVVTVVAPPHAAFVYSPVYPRVNETVTFNASASTPDGGTITSYKWDFGDGSPTKSGTITTHSYVASGDYTVTLNVTDSEGKWDTESRTLKVLKPAEFVVTIEGQYTAVEDTYDFTAPSYCTTFKVEVRIFDAVDLFGYEFWLKFDPTLVQLTNHEINHLHAEDSVVLEEVDNEIGIYKQAVTAEASVQPYTGSATVANFYFHIIKDPCYPYNFTSMLRLDNTKMTYQDGRVIENLQRHGYFNILSVQPFISVEHEGSANMTNWIANSTFTVDISISNIVRMKGFYIEVMWDECIETDIQNVQVTSFLPQPYEIYSINISETMLTVQVTTPLEKPPINGTGTLLRITFKARNPWNGVPPYNLVNGTYVPSNCTCKISIRSGWIDVLCPALTKMEIHSVGGVGVKNDFTYVFTPIPGDLNLDGQVNAIDLSAISQWLDVDSGDPEWTQCHEYDLTGDGRIDIFDIVIVSSNMGRTHP